jgi:hypothetical protein
VAVQRNEANGELRNMNSRGAGKQKLTGNCQLAIGNNAILNLDINRNTNSPKKTKMANGKKVKSIWPSVSVLHMRCKMQGPHIAAFHIGSSYKVQSPGVDVLDLN